MRNSCLMACALVAGLLSNESAPAVVLKGCLERYLSLDPPTRRRSGQVLLRCRSDLQVVPLEPEVAFLRSILNDPDPRVANAAVLLLWHLADARPDSLEMLTDFGNAVEERFMSAEHRRRRVAFSVLEKLNWKWGHEAIPALLALLQETDIDGQIAVTNALAVAGRSDPEGLTLLLESWKTAQGSMRYLILDVFRLADSDDPRVINAHIIGLSDTSTSVRQVAVEALLALGPRAAPALQALESFTREEQDSYLKKKALAAIGCIETGNCR